ncbi:hypothetical protein FKM82_022597 [Ascaphus truei]
MPIGQTVKCAVRWRGHDVTTVGRTVIGSQCHVARQPLENTHFFVFSHSCHTNAVCPACAHRHLINCHRETGIYHCFECGCTRASALYNTSLMGHSDQCSHMIADALSM